MDSTLEKSFKLFFDFLCATSCVLIIPLFFSPVSETLLLVSKERLIFYAISYGLSFLFFGEVVGTRESNFPFALDLEKHIFLSQAFEKFYKLPFVMFLVICSQSFESVAKFNNKNTSINVCHNYLSNIKTEMKDKSVIY